MAKVLNCSLKISKFELQLHYYIHFWTNTLVKGMNLLSFPKYVLNRITIVL